MATYSLTATGVTAHQLAHHLDTVTLTASGTWVGTILVEKSNNGGLSWSNFLPARTTNLSSTTYLIESPDQGDTWLRWRCSAFTSGTIALATVVTAHATPTSPVQIEGEVDNLTVNDILTVGTMEVEFDGDRAAIRANTVEFRDTTDDAWVYIASGDGNGHHQLTTLGSDIWFETGGGGRAHGALVWKDPGPNGDIGWSNKQQDVLPGFRHPRHIAMSGTLFFVATSEAAASTLSSSVCQIAYTGTVAGTSRTLFMKNTDQFKINGGGSQYVEFNMGIGGSNKVQQNIDFWINDAKFVTYSSAANKARAGTATLVGGTVTVANITVTTKTKIILSRNTPGGSIGDLSAPSASRTAATSFVINSASGTDTSTVDWFLIEVET